MASTELGNPLGSTTTRRRIIKTGARLAYGAPLVAATTKMSAGRAAAQVSPGGGCPAQSCCCNCVFSSEVEGRTFVGVCITGTDITTREACLSMCLSLDPDAGFGFGCKNGIGIFTCGRTGPDCFFDAANPLPEDCSCQFASCS